MMKKRHAFVGMARVTNMTCMTDMAHMTDVTCVTDAADMALVISMAHMTNVTRMTGRWGRSPWLTDKNLSVS